MQDYEEHEDLEEYEEEERDEEPRAAFTESYLRTLGMSMSDFL